LDRLEDASADRAAADDAEIDLLHEKAGQLAGKARGRQFLFGSGWGLDSSGGVSMMPALLTEPAQPEPNHEHYC
jgi:hypothetical protein